MRFLSSYIFLSARSKTSWNEFVVIPSGFEYTKLEERLETLKLMLDEEKQSSDEINKQVSISVGTSVFDREKDNSFQEVFERADKKMYEDKKRIHEKDGIPTER